MVAGGITSCEAVLGREREGGGEEGKDGVGGVCEVGVRGRVW